MSLTNMVIMPGADYQAACDAIREKTGSADLIKSGDMAGLIGGIQTGGGGNITAVSPKAVNFYDYDGTVLHAYSKDEFLALTELPPLPEREGLICQGWNNTLEYMQTYTSEYGICNAGATYITDDGTTRIYITLHEGRTSPMLGVCPNGTVTVDWGDGTTPDVLTGTSIWTVKYTPNHNYAEPGDYVIRLTVDGTMGFYGTSSRGSMLLCASNSTYDNINYCYRNAFSHIDIGYGVTSIGTYAFYNCYGLSSAVIPSGVTSIGISAFQSCYGLSSVVIPSGVTSIGDTAFYYCHTLSSAVIPDGVTSIGRSAFTRCYGLSSAVIPSGITSIGGSAFSSCHGLASAVIPSGVTSIGDTAFYYCHSLSSAIIPDGVTSIGSSAFTSCHSLSSAIIPDGVTSIGGSAFSSCYGLAICDFTACTAVPALSSTDAFSGVPADCQFRVPAALAEEWKAATNWSTYASQIVGV